MWWDRKKKYKNDVLAYLERQKEFLEQQARSCCHDKAGREFYESRITELVQIKYVVQTEDFGFHKEVHEKEKERKRR